jgi:DNA-binding XRE family transcriptional regulator
VIIKKPVYNQGEKNNRAKLTVEKVKEIKARHKAGETQRKLAIEYGVSRAAIWLLVHDKTWRTPNG